MKMAKWLTVAELSAELGISERAVRKQIAEGKWTAKKRGTRWLIDSDNGSVEDSVKVHELQSELEKMQAVVTERAALISNLQEENKQLQNRLDKALEDARQERKRSDVIILKLTNQVEQQQFLIEDMSKRKSLWERIKGKLRPVSYETHDQTIYAERSR